MALKNYITKIGQDLIKMGIKKLSRAFEKFRINWAMIRYQR